MLMHGDDEVEITILVNKPKLHRPCDLHLVHPRVVFIQRWPSHMQFSNLN